MPDCIAFMTKPRAGREMMVSIFSPLTRVANRVLSAVFSFVGFRLLPLPGREGPTLPLMEIATSTGEKAQIIEPTYHSKGIEYNAGEGISHAIEFNWTNSISV